MNRGWTTSSRGTTPPAQGRFTSPDEFTGGPLDVFVLGKAYEEKQALPYAEIATPQSLNKYAYAYDNPLRYVDPDGHDVLGYELLVSGPNQVPNPPNREGLPDVHTLGPQTTTRGGHFNLNLRVNFDQNDNIADYQHVRAAIILNSNEPIRNGGDENPSKSQTAVVGQSRFVTDAPGLGAGGPRASLAGTTVVMALAAGEYNTKTKTLSQNVAYYLVKITYDKNGAIDKSKTVAGTLTKDQFIALGKQYKANIPKDKNKQDCPQCLLSPPNPGRH